MSNKKLAKSEKKVIAGVCGGVAEYFGIDVTIVRVIWVICSFVLCGFGLILYIVMWIVLPKAQKASYEDRMQEKLDKRKQE